jgi:protein-S-isoprenylcysteine O-methyltransferase Ste14
MHEIERTFQWTGGAVFAGALAFCAYTFTAVWSAVAPLDRSAAVIDVVLFSLFAAHHSVFAREPVKRWIARLVPERLLRSSYVWLASLLLIGVCGLWRTVGGSLYEVTGWQAVLHAGLQLAGLLIITGAVRKIDALELAGIRKAPQQQPLQISGPYRLVRHPIYLGWLLATFGAAHMTGDRLVFAVISAIYLVVAMPIEERALRTEFGETYVRYEKHVRWRVLPYIY